VFKGTVFLNVFTTLSVSESTRSNFQSVAFETENVTVIKFENGTTDFMKDSGVCDEEEFCDDDGEPDGNGV
jgi:hypothetical protein